MRIDNRVIHAPTGLLSLESNNSEIKRFLFFFFFCQGPQSPTSGTLEPPGHHFMKGCLAHIVRTNTDSCSVESARPSLLNLFRLKVAFFVKGICSVCLRGRESQQDFFPSRCHQIDYCCSDSVDWPPLQQREIFKPSSWTFFPSKMFTLSWTFCPWGILEVTFEKNK